VENPVSFLHAEYSNAIVRSSKFLVRKDPEWKTSPELPGDDEERVNLGTEVWEYDVADGKDQEFKDALLNSGSILEFSPIESVEHD
jgi:hypothetical protein